MHVLLGEGLREMVGDMVDHKVDLVEFQSRDDVGNRMPEELWNKERLHLGVRVPIGEHSAGFMTFMLLPGDAQLLRDRCDEFLAHLRGDGLTRTEFSKLADKRGKK